MDDWSSPLTQNIGMLGVIGFVILLVVGLAARIVWTRAISRNRQSKIGESVLGAIGGRLFIVLCGRVGSSDLICRPGKRPLKA